MDINKINENLDDFNIDELELSEDNLSEIEIEAMKKNIKAKVKKPRKKGKVVAASAAIVITGTMFTPVVAKNLPFISDIYKEFGFFDGYEDYTEYIGKTNIENGYEVTIDNIAVSEDRIMMAIKIKSEKKLDKETIFQPMVNVLETFKLRSSSSSEQCILVDENTMVLMSNIDINGGKIRKKENLDLKIYKIPKDLEKGDTELITEFDIKADFTKALKNSKEISVDKDINDIKVSSINGTVLGTIINLQHKEFIGNSIDLEKGGNEFKLYQGKVDNIFYIKLDDKIYVPENEGAISGEGIFKESFSKLDYAEIEKAKSVEIIGVKIDKYKKEEGGDREIDETTFENEGNIRYIKAGKNKSGKEFTLSKPEIIENGTVRFKYKGNVEPLAVLGRIYLTENSGEYFKCNSGVIKMENGEYILEFSNVNLEMNIELRETIFFNNLENSSVEKIKIK